MDADAKPNAGEAQEEALVSLGRRKPCGQPTMSCISASRTRPGSNFGRVQWRARRYGNVGMVLRRPRVPT
jgi:hypothetical protein